MIEKREIVDACLLELAKEKQIRKKKIGKPT